MLWIAGALYGGYVMANVLKWIWWRFNGYGYFWGMMAGILGAMLIPEFAPQIRPADLLARGRRDRRRRTRSISSRCCSCSRSSAACWAPT